jgi:formyl-CoA transferase
MRNMVKNTDSKPMALHGLKVVELGQLIAGPFAAKLLGEFGAEIVKIEPPNVGDPLRKWRKLENGTSLWWHVQSRHKKSVTLDLKTPEGRSILLKLLGDADILIENFRPGTLENWDMGWEKLHELNPKLIMVRVSGYGQTGPYRDRPGFGIIGEAMGGLRYLNGEPGLPPVRCGISIGDSLSALYAVIGTLLALNHRNQHGGKGQCIDVALYESVFGMMESLVPEYDHFGYIREPSGSALPGIAPTNAYRTLDGKYVLIGGNGDGIFKRLMTLIGREDLGSAERFAHNDGRAREAGLLDAAIEEWTMRRNLADILEDLNRVGVPAGYPYSVADIVADPHYKARQMIETINLPSGKPLKVPAVLPKLSETPGRIGGAGPALGQHTDEVLASIGIDEQTRKHLRERGII